MRWLLFVAWLFCSGFTMPLEWTMPDTSNHEGFIIEYCQTSVNAQNCRRSASGWKEMKKIGHDERVTIIVEERAGQYCYRIRAVNAAGRSGPSQNKCGYNQE